MKIMDRILLDPVHRDFPVGLRVLAVDSDVSNLTNLSSTLQFLDYQVTTRGTAKDALWLLRQKRDEFDILLTEVSLPDMDGFELLSAVTEEFNKSLQVVLFSRYQGCDAAIRALKQGACAFYPKPIPVEVLENLWQHVFKKKIQSCRHGSTSNVVVVEQQSLPPLSSVPNLGATETLKHNKRKRDDVIIGGQVKNGSKKLRICWSPELHNNFLSAIEFIGANNLTPQKILDFMKKKGVEDLTASQVASHLQQYRKTLMKSSSAEEEEEEEILQTSKKSAEEQNRVAVDSFSSQPPPETTTTLDYTTFFQHGVEESMQRVGDSVAWSGADSDDLTMGLDLSGLVGEDDFIINLIACN